MPTDLPIHIPAIRQWVEAADLQNVLDPQALDVASREWPVAQVEFAYTSNSLHIMSWQHVIALYAKLGKLMKKDAFFCVYGPFSFAGKHVSESNQRFDSYLKQRDPSSGVRDTEDLNTLADENGLGLLDSIVMPHNNHILVWKKL